MTSQIVFDALNRRLEVPILPQRIVSLCPSQTETLYALVGPERIVGITNYCIHPKASVGSTAKVGGTKKVDFEAIFALKPDLIIAEKEENTPEIVNTLASKVPVYVTDVRDIPSALEMIQTLAQLVGKTTTGNQLVREIETLFYQLFKRAPNKRVLYMIWRKPYMAAGNDTYINAVLVHLGLNNVTTQIPGRYPKLTATEIQALNPDYVLLSSEPYPFAEKHLEEFKSLLPNTTILIVDGEMFSWYGIRMLKAAPYLHQFLNLLK